MCRNCTLLALDLRPDRGTRSAWIRVRKAERQYATRLRSVARAIGDIVNGLVDDGQNVGRKIETALENYAQTIEPWARAVAEKMVLDVAVRDEKAWKAASVDMGRALHRQISETPLGAVIRRRLEDQVHLITSLPREAAQRVHDLALENITTGERTDSIIAKIMETGQVTRSRATLIARTEVGRTATELTKARAEYVGSTEFIWRTVGDSDVRQSHRALNGKAFRWDQPPECDPGHHALPGSIWNCRCWAEPIIPD